MTFLEKVSNFMKLLGEAHKAGVEGWNENVAKPGDRHPVKTVANFDENENNEFDDFVANEGGCDTISRVNICGIDDCSYEWYLWNKD